MGIFKCKMCGATLNASENQTVVTCDYCGLKQTVANADDERKAGLFNRANSLRQANDFDKALISYQSIISLFPDEPEAHWGACLCRYGIEYVEDPTSKEMKPTMHRASFDSILKDPDYLFALAHADAVAREEYQAEATEISNIQKNILAISQKEQPFDIFICYKETDEKGQRTPDSVIAQDIYDGLTEKGYKVFFSRITLESKLGTMYEPYIFAALNSAKIMLVIGSKPEYFDAVWVKNEWSRFLSLMQTRPGYYLIPCYKDMDAYKMPEEFLSFQAQDLGKLGYQQDLFRGIDKLLGRETIVPQTQTRIIQTDVNIAALLKRATILIGDKNFEKADELLERVLNNDPENSDAYLLKTMVELGVTSVDELKRQENTLENNSNFRKAFDFGDAKQKTKLNAINDAIKTRKEEERLARLYNIALEYKDKKQYADAEKAFSDLAGYRDATKQAAECVTLGKEDIYRRALNLKETKQYDAAIDVFQKVIGFKDAEDQISACNELRNAEIYEKAVSLRDQNQFDEAKEVFMTILNYRDSDFQIDECDRLKLDAKKEQVYKRCIFDHEIETNKDAYDLRKICEALTTIPGYKDVDQLLTRYEGMIDEFEKKLAEEKEIQRRERAKRLKKIRKVSLIGGSSAIGLTSILLLTFLYLVPSAKQRNIQKAIDSGDYATAYTILDSNSWFGDANGLFEMARAGEYFSAKDYESGIKHIYDIGGTVDVTYDTDGGNSSKKTDTIKKKSKFITNIADKEGYDFHGWVLNNYQIKSADHYANITLKASYKTITYSIDIDLDGGQATSLPTKYNTEQAVPLPNPTKKGYTFLGWTGSNLASPVDNYVIPEGSIGNRHYKANWKANEYTVTLDAAGGTISTKKVNVVFDKQYSIPTPTYRGHTFQGWYTSEGVKFADSGIYTRDSDMLLTARWNAIDYQIKYELNGGTNSPLNPSTYTADNGNIQIRQPTRRGYTFTGWSVDGGSEVKKNVQIDAGSIGNRTLTAHWAANVYKVTLDPNGGSSSGTASYVTFDSWYDFRTISRTGYTLIGYYPDSDFENQISPSGVWNIARDCQLTAIWQANTNTAFTVNLFTEKLDGSGYELRSAETKHGTSDSTINFSAIDVPGFTPKETYKTISIAPDGSTVVDFHYTRNSYTLDFVTNGGESIEPITLKYEEELPASVFGVREGFTFDGWYTDASQQTKLEKMPASNSTAYAYYKEETKACNFAYSINEDGVTIDKLLATSSKNIVVPNYISGKEVVAIGSNAFANNATIKSVKLPETIERLGSFAFQGCAALDTVEGTSRLLEIEESTFEGCRVLTKFPDLSSVTKIGNNAFKDCSSLTGIAVSENLSEIGSCSFSGCISLLQTPDLTHVTKIGDFAFDGCTMLSEIKGLAITNSFGERVLNACENIAKLSLTFRDELEQFYVSKMFGFSDYSSGSENFYSALTQDGQTYYVPKKLTEIEAVGDKIPSYFAYGLTSLTSFKGSDTMSEVGAYSFYGCSSLASFNGTGFNLGQSVSKIGDYAFAESGANFATLVLPDSLSIVGNYAFKNWSLITEVVVPDGISDFGNGVFSGAMSLIKLTAPKIFDLKEEESSNSYSINNEIGTYHWTLSDGVYTSTNQGKASSDSEIQLTFNVAGSLNLSYMVRTYGSSYGRLYIYKNGSAVVDAYSNMSSFSDKEIAVAKGDVLKIVYHKYYSNSYGYDDLAKIKFNSFKNNLEANPIGHLNNFFGKSLENDNADVPSSLKEVCLTQAENIRDNAFAQCASIEKIDLNGAESIGENAFLNCSSLKSLIIPETVESIKANSLSGCSSLESLELPFVGTSAKSNEDLGVLFGTNAYDGSYSATQHSGTYYFPSNLKNLTINKGTIASGSCKGLSTIVSLAVGDSVESIGSGAFRGLDSLESIALPFVGKSDDASDVESVFGHIFGYTSTRSSSSYSTVDKTFINHVYGGTVGGATWQYSMRPNGDYYSYHYYIPATLKEVTVTSDATIPVAAFNGCSMIEKIAIPDSTVSIGACAFQGCSQLKRLNSASDGAFNLPSGITSVPSYAFANCSLASEITLSDSVVEIGDYAFSGCSAVSKFNSGNAAEIAAPASCKSIGAGAFRGMALITGVTVGDSAESIGDGAFRGMDSLKRVSLPFVGSSENPAGDLEKTLGHVFGYTRTDYTAKTAKTSDGKGYTYQGYYRDYYYCYYIPSGLTEVTITRQTSIPERAFYNCDLIERIRIPDGVDSIGASAFYGCAQLKRLNGSSDGAFNLPSGVASIQKETFCKCASATEFSLPEGVESIGESAFEGCPMVSKVGSENPGEIVVPASCTSIGANAFRGMALIESLTVGDSAESIGDGAFRGMDSLKRVSLPFVGSSENPAGDLEKTLGHVFGYAGYSRSYFKTSDGQGYTYQGYGSGSTCYCYYIPSGLTEVTITRQTSIPERAFYNCDTLITVTLVNSVYSIGDNAFYNCNAEVNKTYVPTRGSTWDGHSVATAFHGGTGTASDPYQIFDPREFVYFANQVNAGNHYENTYFNITSDLSLGGNKIDSIAQDTEHAFKGYFDGKGHTIRNFELTPIDSDVIGLFGYLEGTICNTGFENMTCSATMTTNANVYVGMLVGNLTGTMSNCYATGSLNINANRALYSGGLVGENNGKISDCYSNVKLTAKSTNQKCYVGGLVGFNNGSLDKCFSCGNISSTGYAQSYSIADALIGDEGTSSAFSDCFHSDNQQIVAHGVAVPASESKGTNASIAAIVAFCKANWTYKGWNYSKDLPTF